MQQEFIEHALGQEAAEDADAGAVAATTVGAVRLLLRELKPLVGERAACALYSRSLHLARVALPRAPPSPQTHDELLAPLHEHLASCPSGVARQGGRALLNALVDLLVSLIGEPLTHKLLRKAWPGADAPASEPEPR